MRDAVIGALQRSARWGWHLLESRRFIHDRTVCRDLCAPVMRADGISRYNVSGVH
jgi:hypothetical protein